MFLILNDEKFNKVNPNILEEHWNYFSRYYGSDFIPNQGTEQILDAISHYSVSGSWLDLGGGSNSYFWLAAMKNITDVTVIDKDIEACIVLSRIRSMLYCKGCYKYVMDRYNVNPHDLYNTPLTYIAGDLFSFPLNVYTQNRYDIITQIGLWGLLKSSTEYLQKLAEACAFLNSGGVLISANWIFEEPLITRRGYNNKYLNCKMIKDFAETTNKELCYIEEVPIYGDPLYSKVFIHVIREK